MSHSSTKPWTSTTRPLAWVMAVLGGAAAIIVYLGVLLLYAFLLSLAGLPPYPRAITWADTIRVQVFAGLPVLVAVFVGLKVKHHASGLATAGAVLWAIALTSALCFAAFAAYRVAWPTLP